LSFSEKEQHEQVISSLAPYVEQGKKIGLDIVVENMRPVPQIFPYRRYCAEAEELCRVADDLELGICWDFGHANIAGLKQSEALACVGSRLRMLHVNDNFAWGDDHVPPFIGTINWVDAMQGLRAVGFNGLLNYELTTGRVPANAREAYAKYILEAAARLNELFNA
jgi:sugar phosphate isomerase/epimerase